MIRCNLSPIGIFFNPFLESLKNAKKDFSKLISLFLAKVLKRDNCVKKKKL